MKAIEIHEQINKNHVDPLISVILPVYQVKPYLRECLDSIVGQTFESFEVIIIDDGSTDGGEQICDEYAANNHRIRVIHQENRGLSAARNVGLEKAKGKYIAMVDSDDALLSRSYLQILYDGIIKYDADVAVCKIPYINENGPLPAPTDDEIHMEVISGRDVFVDTRYDGDSPRFILAYGKLYHRKCFKGVRYPEGRLMEDLAVYHRLLYDRERIVVVDFPMYGRRRRSGSITSDSFDPELHKAYMTGIDECIAFLLSKGDEQAVANAIKRKTHHQMKRFFKSLARKNPEEAEGMVKEFEELIGYVNMLAEFEKADPNEEMSQTRKYYSDLIDRIITLLYLAPSVIKRQNITIKGDQMIYEAAYNEGLSPALHVALCHDRERSEIARSRDEEYIRAYKRQYILMEYSLKKIRERAADKGIGTAIFDAPDIYNMYPEPWLRARRSVTCLMLASG